MSSESLDNYRWLISAEGQNWFETLAGDSDSKSLVQQTNRLRKQLTAGRTHLLLELLELRKRATAKFSDCSRMFFTRRGLEQATDQWIAAHKAQRFSKQEVVADLCCGIGGDLFGIAAHTDVTGVDRDPIHALIAEANCQMLDLRGSRIETADANTLDLQEYAAWHIDPDRRPAGQRTTQLEYAAPSTLELEQLLKQSPHGAVKSAPATDVPGHWNAMAERQWIGSGRECKQQVIWFGHLALHPGRHSAAVVHHRGRTSDLLVGSPDEPIAVATNIDDYVFEPHATVLAASLVAILANQHDLRAIDRQVDYLTAGSPVDDPLIGCFSVLEVLPFDRRQLRAAMKHHDIGRLEVKIRGVPGGDPDTIRQQVQGRGEQPGCLIVTPHAGSAHAIICRRHGS